MFMKRIITIVLGLMVLSITGMNIVRAQDDEIEAAQDLLLPGQQKAVASVFQYLPDSMAIIVWRVTPALSANCCWVIWSRSKRSLRI